MRKLTLLPTNKIEMKKLVLILSLAAGLSVTGYAQQRAKSPEKRASHVTKVLQQKLNLSSDQAFQVHSIMLTQATRIDSLRSNVQSPDGRPNRRAMKTIMATTDENLSYVLSPDQQKAYFSWKAERKDKMRAKKNLTAKLES